MRRLTIDRTKWVRGGLAEREREGWGDTRLLNENGRMCCLGFDCMRLRHETKKSIYLVGLPQSIDVSVSRAYDTAAADINDDAGINDYTREKMLVELYKRYGIKLTFKN